MGWHHTPIDILLNTLLNFRFNILVLNVSISVLSSFLLICHYILDANVISLVFYFLKIISIIKPIGQANKKYGRN